MKNYMNRWVLLALKAIVILVWLACLWGQLFAVPGLSGALDTELFGIVMTRLSVVRSVVYTRTGKRRLIINVGIGYSSDLLKAKNVLKKIFEENPGIMKDQPVQVVVDALGDSSVVLSARGWTTCEDYWTAKWSITEAIKLTFDKEGIEIPYQYMNVMMTKES